MDQGTQREKAAAQFARYTYMRDQGHTQFLTKAQNCENFFAGLQWDVQDLQALQAVRRPALTINKIISTLSTIFGEQIKNRMEVSFRPKSGAPAENADVLNKVWMHISDNNQLQWVRSDVFADGLVRSRGFYDARIEFNDNMQGEVAITKLNSKNVVIDPDAEEYDPDSWSDVIVTKWLTPMDIELLFDADAAKELKDRTGSVYAWGFDSVERVRDRFSGPIQSNHYSKSDNSNVARHIRVLERQYRELVRVKMFVDPVTGDTREVPEAWDRNRIAAVAAKYGLQVVKKLAKKIRWCVTADDLVLHDEISPYKHLTPVPYFPIFRDGTTIGAVESLLSPQELLNKTTSQELHVVNTTANSGWKIKKGGLTNLSVEELEARGAQTGLVLELDSMDSAEKIQPNQIPTGLDRLSFKAEEAIKSISKVSDSMAGFDREDVAAKAIAYKTQRGSVNFSKEMDNLERSDWLLARNVLDMIQAFYTEERVFNITHDKLLGETEQLTINQENAETGEILNDLTLGEFEVVVTSAPFRATLEDSQFDQAVAMRELGIPIPDDVLIENSRLMRKTELAKRLQEATSGPDAKAAQELEQRRKEAEVADLEAQVAERQANAQAKLAQAKAAEGQDPAEMERFKAEQDIALAREKQNAELELAREKQAFELQQMQVKQEAELEMQREESRQRGLAERAKAAMQAATVKQPEAVQ